MDASKQIVDLTPLLTPLWQLLGTIIGGIALGIFYRVWNVVANKANLSWLVIDQAKQEKIDAEAQKAIGGAVAAYGGKLPQTIDATSPFVQQAAQKIISSVGQQIKDLNEHKTTEQVAQSAVDIVMNRIGMMQATATGTPIPNPSAEAKQPSAPVVVAAPIVAAP